jgi:hypothetical protein
MASIPQSSAITLQSSGREIQLPELREIDVDGLAEILVASIRLRISSPPITDVPLRPDRTSVMMPSTFPWASL